MKVTPMILLMRGRGFISSLIRFQTRSEFTHAAILIPTGEIIEAYQGDGVRKKRLADWRGVTGFTVPRATARDWARVIAFMEDEIGAMYDYQSVLQFVTRRKETRASQDKWFCSELVFAAFEAAGIDLLERTTAANTSPRDLSLSPLLHQPRRDA